MTTLSALLYADARSIVNALHDIRRSPSRALLWIFFVLLVAALIVMRVLRASRIRHRTFTPEGTPGFAEDAIVCVAILAFAGLLAFGNRYAGLFANPAEGRFVIGSRATPFIAVMYIQVRQIAVAGVRQAFGLLYFALIYLPATLPAAELVRDLVLLGSGFILIAAVPLARQLLPPRLAPFCIVAGVLLLVAGALPCVRHAALFFAPQLPAAALIALPDWHPGALLVAGVRVQLTMIGLIAAATAGLFAYVARLANDAYPELYALSLKRFARTERMRNARLFGTRRHQPKLHGERASLSAGGTPGGTAIFVWRAWTEYRHTSSTRGTAVETALALIAGYAIARLIAVSGTDVLIAFGSPIVNIAFILAVVRSASLAGELRRPLFWLSDATLFARLCALAAAQSWRLIGWCLLLATGLAAGKAPPIVVAGTACTGPIAILLACSVGYASYALLPHDADQRGPLRLVRLLIGYILLVPPVAAAIIAAFVLPGPLFALGCATATMLAEGAVLLGFAAWRLDGMSIALR